MKSISWYSVSDVGRRGNNEDACLECKLSEGFYLFAVADGMGGAVGGEVASNLALSVLEDFVKINFSQELSAKKLKELLWDAVGVVQAALAKRIKKEPELKGMGTTLTGVLIFNGKYLCFNLGDSRTYSVKDNQINQVSVDHTFVEDFKQKNNGEISPHMLKQYGNLLIKSVDGGEDMPEVFPLDKDCYELNGDEIILLCSDGLIMDGWIDQEKEFLKIILAHSSKEDGVKALIHHALESGSNDNITVQLIEYGNRTPKANELETIAIKLPEKKKPIKKHLLIAFILLVLISTSSYFIISASDKQISDKDAVIKKETPVEVQTLDSIGNINNKIAPEKVEVSQETIQKEIKNQARKKNESLDSSDSDMADDNLPVDNLSCKHNFKRTSDQILIDSLDVDNKQESENNSTHKILKVIPQDSLFQGGSKKKSISIPKGKLISDENLKLQGEEKEKLENSCVESSKQVIVKNSNLTVNPDSTKIGSIQTDKK